MTVSDDGYAGLADGVEEFVGDVADAELARISAEQSAELRAALIEFAEEHLVPLIRRRHETFGDGAQTCRQMAKGLREFAEGIEQRWAPQFDDQEGRHGAG